MIQDQTIFRKQISLKFTDGELFHALIEPLHQNRQLTDVIIKCLSAYYYNEDWRNVVDGTSIIIDETSIFDDNNKQQELKDARDEVRKLLQMQSMIAEELEDTLLDGMDNIQNSMSEINNAMEERGFVHKETDANSNTILRITDSAKQVMSGSATQNTTRIIAPQEPTDSFVTQVRNEEATDQINIISPTVVEDDALSTQENTVTSTEDTPKIIAPIEVTQEEQTETIVSKPVADPVLGEAKSDLGALLSSLDF